MGLEARILMTGATGLIGGRLAPALLRENFDLRCLTRDTRRAAERLPEGASAIAWDGRNAPRETLAGARAVLHLAGEPVFAGRLTRRRRSRIRASRIESTRTLVDAIAALPESERPEAFVCASAVGVYGSRGEEVLDEEAAPGRGFRAEICRDWETAAERAADHGVRACSLRIGIVLAREGGALPMMALPFRLGLGGPLGDGRQWVPWIHADDLIGLVLRVLHDGSIGGPINAVAPEPIRNRDLTRSLAGILHRPAWVRAPAFAVRAALGELAEELLGSRRAVPKRAQELGIRFEYPSIDAALRAELARG